MEKQIKDITLVEGIQCYIEYLRLQVAKAKEKDGLVYSIWYGLWIIVIGLLVLPVGIGMRLWRRVVAG